MKRKLLVIASMVVAAAMFTACSNTGNSGAADNAASQETSEEAGADSEKSAETESTGAGETDGENVSENNDGNNEAENTDREAASGEAESGSAGEADAASGDSAEAPEGKSEGVRTKVLNKTGKVVSDVTFKSDSTVLGVGSLDDGKSAETKIAANEKDVRLEFSIDGEITRLPIDDGFQGSKLVIKADDADGFLIDYEGIDEED